MEIGVDIVKVSRIEKAMKNEHFIKRVFTKDELIYMEKKPIETAAGLFACKEAISKALQTGFSDFLPKDIEILHCEGRPIVKLHGKANKKLEDLGFSNIKVSISHEEAYAVATSIAY